MPTYDYRCESGHRYEKRERFGSPAQQPCERCGKQAQRVLTSPTVVFKGSGWYKTDSRGNGASRAAADRDSDDGAEKTVAKAGTDSKTEGNAKSKSEGSAKSETATKTTRASTAKSSASTNGASGSGSIKRSTKRSSD